MAVIVNGSTLLYNFHLRVAKTRFSILFISKWRLPITITAITIISYQSIINVTKVSGESVLVRQGVK